MNVSRDGKPFMRRYVFSPFYAWTCVERGNAHWASESTLHFRNLSAQGREIEAGLLNKTDKTVPYVEVWVRSVDANGYPHSPSIFLVFDTESGDRPEILPEIFPGAEYFMVRCEVQGKAATSRFVIPSRRGWPHDVDLDDVRKNIKIELTANGPVIDGGDFETLSDEEAKTLVPDGVRLHLREARPITNLNLRTAP